MELLLVNLLSNNNEITSSMSSFIDTTIFHWGMHDFAQVHVKIFVFQLITLSSS